MATVSFSMRLDRSLKSRLDRLAKHADRPSSYLVSKAVEQMLDELENRKKLVEEIFREDDDRVYVSEELVDGWVKSWASDKRLSKPNPDIFDGAKAK
jgi:predicted transcriptional regulator